MEPIKVNKEHLLDTLRKNRDEHRAMFLKAHDIYCEKMAEEFTLRAKEARENSKVRRAFTMPVPEDHTVDYDTVIGMLEWDEGDVLVELSHRDFMTYVRNDWGWQQSFAANTQSYLVEEQ